MPRVSKRNKRKNPDTQPVQQVKYYRAGLYIRLSEKDGGHGRRDSIYIQQQICADFVKEHPEMLLQKTYTDNGVTGTTFARPGFEQLMEDVRGGSVDCIIVKDFSRFGRDAVEAVDLIDVVFPTLGVRFISVLDDYDSENPACVQDRVNHILKHFMNDYYAREVSAKLVQAHKLSKEKGEFWGPRPPYGYKRSEESSKKLVPEESEKEVVQKIFYWYVFDNMSSYDIAKKLNDMEVPSPAESYEMRRYGEVKSGKRSYWLADRIRNILQNQAYIGAAVYGKTKKQLHENVPLNRLPREQWEVRKNAWEPLVEQTIFQEAQRILKQRQEENLEKKWKVNPGMKRAAAGPFLGRIYCGNCGKRLQRIKNTAGKYQTMIYRCTTVPSVEGSGCIAYVKEGYVMEAVKLAMQYQIRLAADYKKQYGRKFYTKLEQEAEQDIRIAKNKYEKCGRRLEMLSEHYFSKLLNKAEYLGNKEIYLKEQEEAHEALEKVQNHWQKILEYQQVKMEWAEKLIKCQKITEITREIVDRFIESIVVESKSEITVCFWFGDIFEEEMAELSDLERGALDAV